MAEAYTTYDPNKSALSTSSLSAARAKELESRFDVTIADAIRWFDAIAFYGMRSGNLKRETRNTVKAYENKMKALDNQVLYVKNQLQDKFNSAIANDVVATAARGLRVSMSNILEKHKESAHNINMDIQTVESNARMDKATYKSYQEQAKIGRKAGQYALNTELAQTTIKLAADLIMEATGGGANAAWKAAGSPSKNPEETVKNDDKEKEPKVDTSGLGAQFSNWFGGLFKSEDAGSIASAAGSLM